MIYLFSVVPVNKQSQMIIAVSLIKDIALIVYNKRILWD